MGKAPEIYLCLLERFPFFVDVKGPKGQWDKGPRGQGANGPRGQEARGF